MNGFRCIATAIVLLVCGTVSAQQRNINFDLLQAARTGSADQARTLLEQGANPNSRNRLGDTPLNTAARNGDVEVVKLLIARAADVNLANLARVTPLMSAVYGGHVEVARLLLATNASVEPVDRMEKTAMIYAAGNGNVPVNQRYAHDATALMWAAAYGKDDSVKLLLERGADLAARDERGESALSIAEAEKHAGTAALLRSAGATK